MGFRMGGIEKFSLRIARNQCLRGQVDDVDKTPMAVQFHRQLCVQMRLTECENVLPFNVSCPFEQMTR